MNVLIGLLFALEILVALLLGGVVMLQKPKDGGLNTAIGGGFEASLGAQAGSVLTKTTIILGVIFLLDTLVLSRLTAHRGASIMEDVRTAPVQQAQPAAAPS
ncbi:MAG: preprotein translocase subunit SecG, partial [Kiritimatiellae bacterium]|nr:preprotein translocase subunit SecG [Kiritimatiellia bacterium]